MAEDARVYRAAISTYVVFGTLCGIPFALGVTAFIRHPSMSAISFFAMPLAACLISYAWIAFYKLQIGPEAITYRSLFGGCHSVRLADIGAAWQAVGVSEYRDRFLPHVRVELRMKPGVKPSKIAINAKVFTLEAVNDLLRSLSAVWQK